MDSQPRERPLADKTEAEEAPDPNRSPILDPRDRSPLLPPLKQPADNRLSQLEAAGQGRNGSEAANHQPDNRPETGSEEFLQAGLELGRINDRIEVVNQKIDELEGFVTQHPAMVALEQNRDRAWDSAREARKQSHRLSLEVGTAKSNWDHEKQRVRQYENDIRARCAEARATREAADKVWRQYYEAPTSSPEEEALRQEWSRLCDQARDELKAAIEADPGARQARRRCDQARSYYYKIRDEIPAVREPRQRWTDGFEEIRELEKQIWADNPGPAEADRTLREERSQLRSQQYQARGRLDQAIKELGQPPQPPEIAERDANLVSHD